MNATLDTTFLQLIYIHETSSDGADIVWEATDGAGQFCLGHFQSSLSTHQIFEEGTDCIEVFPEVFI